MREARKVFVVENDRGLREELQAILSGAGFDVSCFDSAMEFLADEGPKAGCLVLDIALPGRLDLQHELRARGADLQVVMLHSDADIGAVLGAIKEGAVAFADKSHPIERLLAGVRLAFKIGLEARRIRSEAKSSLEKLYFLTQSEQQILEKIAGGRSDEETAAELGLSRRTVEAHRSRIVHKLIASGLSDAADAMQAPQKLAG